MVTNHLPLSSPVNKHDQLPRQLHTVLTFSASRLSCLSAEHLASAEELHCRRTMMAFAGGPGGGQPVSPMLPGTLINARLVFTGQRRASDPFSPSSVSRSSSSTPTVQNRSPESQAWPSISSLAGAKASLAGFKVAADSALSQGIGSNQTLAYPMASLPHYPTHPAGSPGTADRDACYEQST